MLLGALKKSDKHGLRMAVGLIGLFCLRTSELAVLRVEDGKLYVGHVKNNENTLGERWVMFIRLKKLVRSVVSQRHCFRLPYFMNLPLPQNKFARLAINVVAVPIWLVVWIELIASFYKIINWAVVNINGFESFYKPIHINIFEGFSFVWLLFRLVLLVGPIILFSRFVWKKPRITGGK